MEVIVTNVSKLVYNLFTGLTTYIYRGYNPFAKYHGHPVPSLKLTAKAPENRPKPKRKGSSSNHQFSGAMLVSGRVISEAIFAKTSGCVVSHIIFRCLVVWVCLGIFGVSPENL